MELLYHMFGLDILEVMEQDKMVVLVVELLVMVLLSFDILELKGERADQ